MTLKSIVPICTNYKPIFYKWDSDSGSSTFRDLDIECDAPAGIRTRVTGSKGRNDWPDYTTGAY